MSHPARNRRRVLLSLALGLLAPAFARAADGTSEAASEGGDEAARDVVMARIADARADHSEVAGRIEETGVPALPVRQKLLDLFAQRGHDRKVAQAP